MKAVVVLWLYGQFNMEKPNEYQQALYDNTKLPTYKIIEYVGDPTLLVYDLFTACMYHDSNYELFFNVALNDVFVNIRETSYFTDNGDFLKFEEMVVDTATQIFLMVIKEHDIVYDCVLNSWHLTMLNVFDDYDNDDVFLIVEHFFITINKEYEIFGMCNKHIPTYLFNNEYIRTRCTLLAIEYLPIQRLIRIGDMILHFQRHSDNDSILLLQRRINRAKLMNENYCVDTMANIEEKIHAIAFYER